MLSESTVKFTITDNGVAVVALSRPQLANALNSQMALELKNIFNMLSDRASVAILTGEGTKAFCAGADLKERNSMNTEAWEKQHLLFREVIKLIMDYHVPVIAAVNGAAYGGGLELALSCDFVYAVKTANFALPEVTLGIMPGMGGTQTLPRAVGLARAKELLFTGKSFSAAEAYSWGMVNKICEPESLMEEALACANKIADNAPLSVRAVKYSANSMFLPKDEALAIESEQYKKLLGTKDRYEGISAFNEKRKPVFTGK